MEIPSKAPIQEGFKMPRLNEIDKKPPEFMKAIKEFVECPKGFFLIAGKNGNGKTFTARAIYEHFYHPHGDNKFFKQADLNIKWQQDFTKWGSTEYLLQELVKAPLLVLDDIGTRKPTEAFMDFLYLIADKRYDFQDSCGTIITTNLNANSMREIFGDAFVSRVASGICVRHDGEDRRINKF